MKVLYVLRLRDGSYYAGVSGNFDSRFQQIQAGEGPYVTRDLLPASLAFSVGPFTDFETARAARTAILPASSDIFQSLLNLEEAGLRELQATLNSVPLHYVNRDVMETEYTAWVSQSSIVERALSEPEHLLTLVPDIVGPRDGDIVMRRLLEGLTFAKLATQHGISRTRAGQIHYKVSGKLRRAFARSPKGSSLLSACRSTSQRLEFGALSADALTDVVETTLGWVPNPQQLALLSALVAYLEPKKQ